MHNSNLNYKHMLQCTKVGSKITCVSLGACLGPMQEMGMNFKHQGTVVGETTPMGSEGIPTTVGGARGCAKSGSRRSTRGNFIQVRAANDA